MAAILQGGVRDTVKNDSSGNLGKFEVTNFAEDLTFDADTASLNVTSDVLATLIRELIRRGVINGTVA